MQTKLRNRSVMFKTREELIILKWDRLVAKMTQLGEKTKDSQLKAFAKAGLFVKHEIKQRLASKFI
jgi:hypothetical protein